MFYDIIDLHSSDIFIDDLHIYGPFNFFYLISFDVRCNAKPLKPLMDGSVMLIHPTHPLLAPLYLLPLLFLYLSMSFNISICLFLSIYVKVNRKQIDINTDKMNEKKYRQIDIHTERLIDR